MFSNDLTKVAASNPDAKHFLSKDLFVSIQSLPASQMDVELAMSAEDSLEYNRYELAIGDTLFTKDKYAVVEYLSFEPKHPDFKEENSDVAIAVGLRFRDLAGEYNKSIEPAISLADDMLYQYPDQIDELGVKVKINEESFDSYFSMEDALDYSEFIVSKEEVFEFNGLTFSLKGFDKNIDNRNYKAEDGDIAIKALVKFEDGSSNQLLKPVYLIRDNKPQSLKDYNPEYGIHIRMTHIDPVNERFNFQLAADDRSESKLVLDIAEDVPRTDFIGIEAIEFPGINLFWAGSILMLLGFFLSFFFRMKMKYA